MKREYHRHLPHQVPDGFPIFLTWNLKGAMPEVAVERIRRERTRLDQQPLRTNESKKERALRHWKTVFALADDFLDQSGSGPLLLRDSALANCRRRNCVRC